MHVLTTLPLVLTLAGQVTMPGVPGAGPAPSEEADSSSSSSPTPERRAPTTSGPCADAKQAVGLWLDALRHGRENRARAALCAEAPPGWTPQQTETALAHLKRVLDARAIRIHVDELPSDPAYIDAETGVARVPLTHALGGLYVHRVGDRWLISAETLSHTQDLYHATFPLDVARLTDKLPSWTRVPVFGVMGWQIIFLFALLLLGFIVRLIVSGLLGSQIERVMAKLRQSWGEALIRNASLPLGNLALAGVLALGMPSLQLALGPAQILAVAVRTLAAFSIVHLVYRSTDLLGAYLGGKASKTKTKLDDQLVPILVRSLKVGVVVVGVIFVLQNLDIDVTSLLTGLGLGGLAFALAAKDVVVNLFGSLTIFMDKPFQIGDWVNTCGVEGTVEEVGIRSTRIRTFYNSLVTVPNGKFTDAIVDNYGMREVRRTSATLGLTYDTPPEKIEAFCDGVRAIIQAHPATWKEFYEVQFVGYGDFSLNIMVYFFFDVDTWSKELRARHEIYLDILRLAGELGVHFAFPTRTLHVDTLAAAAERTPPPHADVQTLKQTVAAFGPGGDKVVPPGPRVHGGFLAGSPPAE